MDEETQDFCVAVDGTCAVCRVMHHAAFRMVTVETAEIPGNATMVRLLQVAERHARAMGLDRIRFLRFSQSDLPPKALYQRMGFRCTRFGVASGGSFVYEVLKTLR